MPHNDALYRLYHYPTITLYNAHVLVRFRRHYNEMFEHFDYQITWEETILSDLFFSRENTPAAPCVIIDNIFDDDLHVVLSETLHKLVL